MKTQPSIPNLMDLVHGIGYAAVVSAAIALTGCDVLKDRHDKGVSKTRDAYKSLLEPPAVPTGNNQKQSKSAKSTDTKTRDIPQLSKPPESEQTPALFPNPRISVSVTEKVPIKDVLFQLGQQAGVDMQIDSRISGGIIFSAHDTPFLQVIKRISKQAGLRYSVRNNVVHIRVDTPYMKHYRIPYITQSRTSTSEVAISTQLSSAAVGQGGGQGGNTSSSTTVSAKAKSDLYKQLETALKTIMMNTAPRGLSASKGQQRDPVAVMPQSGTVSVFGNSQQHKAIQSYLDRVRRSISAQVRIEGKIIEVNLSRKFESGINWNAVFDKLTASASFDNLQTSASGTASSGVATLAFNGDDIQAVVDLLGRFGTTRTLSSPRLTVMNNQTAILKVAENQVFFEIQAQEEEEENSTGPDETELTVESQIRTVPVGLVMAVRPAINVRENRVTLTLRPTVSRVDRFVEDPGVALVSELVPGADVQSRIPVVETREIDSVLDVKSGQTAILGGLMQERTNNEDTGVPGLSQIPWLGRAFKQRSENTEMVELVILLNVEIVSGTPQPGQADSRVYREFTRDPRPLPMPNEEGAASSQQ